MDTTNLIAYLPFDESTTQDLCYNTWTTSGSPTIEDAKLVLNGSSYLQMTEKFEFTGQPFTISCKFSATQNNTGKSVCLWQMYIDSSNRFQVYVASNGTLRFWLNSDSNTFSTSASVLDGQEHHTECVFDGSTWYLFFDGNLVESKAITLSKSNYTLYVGRNHVSDANFTGILDEFMIYDGIALHTENFTPPTAEDYAALKMVLSGTTLFPLVRLKAYLPFDSSTTEDLCGNTWEVDGTEPTIQNQALDLTGSTYLYTTAPTLGSLNFTLHWWEFIPSSQDSFWRDVVVIDGTTGTHTHCLDIMYDNTNYPVIYLGCGKSVSSWTISKTSIGSKLRDQWVHRAIVRSGSTIFAFENGKLFKTISFGNYSIDTSGSSLFIGGLKRGGTQRRFIGQLSNFMFHVGIALWTANFTPPTADEYTALKLSLAGSAPVVLNCDVERKVAAPVQVNFDVQRVLWQKWLYYNLGNADTLTISGTTLTNLPATKSKTGSAFYQTARQKCFDLPATNEVWIKFDVYFDGSNRWRAYNGGSNGVTGITAQTTNAIYFFSNKNEITGIANAAKKNQLQTVLLHMVSGSSTGVVEAWLDGSKIYTFTGDVNHGQDFNDIYLQSDGAGTFFSNVIISNSEISLDAGFCSVTFDVERRISKAFEITFDVERNFISPIIVPFIGNHFNHFVESLTLFPAKPQKIILPKESKVYVRAGDEGTLRIFSDSDNDGVVSSEVFAALDECNSVFLEVNSFDTPKRIIKNFMYSLSNSDETNSNAFNEAINFCTDGAATSKSALADFFLADLDASASYSDFLRDYCDIILDNDDTGAITGSDAGGGAVKTAESIVPENIPVEQWQTPSAGSSVTIDGLTVHFPSEGVSGELNDKEKFILAGLNSVWTHQALLLIEKSFGLNFFSAYLRDITVSFSNETNNTVASVSVSLLNNVPDALTLIINMSNCKSIDMTSADGLIPNHDIYLDRILAHEFTHAVMAANIRSYSKLPTYIREGAAELVHGTDDLRRTGILSLDTDFTNSQLREIFVNDGYFYAAYRTGYVFLRYLAKFGQRKIFRNSVTITHLLISDGGFDSYYNTDSDYTRQIFSADVSRVLERSLALNCDVELLTVISVDFLLDVKRSLLAHLILFPRSSEDFFADDNNPFVVRQSNALLAKPRKLRSATPANTDGLQNFELQIAEQQITDQVRFSAVIPFDIMQQVSGQYLDYHYNMRVERVQQQGILYSCDCCSDVDQLLYTQIAYKIPPITTWWKIDGEEVGGTPKTVEFQTIYPSAAEHANRIAAALGLSPVIQFDHFLSTVLMDEKGGVTYNDLIRDIFGWSSRVPTMLINIFIRDGKLYFIQRGHEAHTVDISNAQMTVPVITKEIVRTSWGSSVESRTNVSEFDAKIMTFTPDTIVGGDSSGDDDSGYTIDPDSGVAVRDASVEINGLDIEGYTSYSYDSKGLLRKVKSYTEQKSTGDTTDTTIQHSYDSDGTMTETRTNTTSRKHDERGNSTITRTESIEEKKYVTLANGEKFLASEHSSKYEDGKLVDELIVNHSPTRVGQSHSVAVSSSGIIGESTGQNTGDDRVSPYRNAHALSLAKDWENKKWDEKTGTWRELGSWEENTTHYEHGMTVYGLSLFDSSFPIHDQATLIKVTNALKNLNRKTKETVNVSIYDFEHIIDFNDKIRLNGAEYFLAANTARTTPRIMFEQNLTLVRWD